MNASSFKHVTKDGVVVTGSEVASLYVPREQENRYVWIYYENASFALLAEANLIFSLGGQEVLRLPAQLRPGASSYLGLACNENMVLGGNAGVAQRLSLFWNNGAHGTNFPIPPIPLKITCDQIALMHTPSGATIYALLGCLSSLQPI